MYSVKTRNALPSLVWKFLALVLLLTLGLTALNGVQAEAAEGKLVQTSFYDYVGLTSPQEAKTLNLNFAAFTEETGYNFIYVIADDMLGKATRDYAADLYDEMFPEDPASGAILLLDLENRELNFVTSGEMIDIVTDYDEERIYDAAWDSLVEGNYYQVGLDVLHKLESLVERGVVAGHRRVSEDEAKARPRGLSWYEAGISAILSLGGGLSYVLSTRSSYKPQTKKMGYDFLTNSLIALKDPVDELTGRRIRYLPPPQTRSRSGSSRTTSTTFRGSSGRTHGGGGGRKF